MAYNGTVSDDLMVTLADLLKERLVANDDVKRSKLIFAVFMEGVQNLIWHGKEHEENMGMILITEHEKEITIMCGNRIEKDKTQGLKER
jgi:anti-sigma regulatory factor (Ser/Thr protein kinase)